MSDKFNALPWHDAELLAINIDRSHAGLSDIVVINVKWPDSSQNTIIFHDCYRFDAQMNFGVIAEESILDGVCSTEDDQICIIKSKWQLLGVELNDLCCYQIVTNSTNSNINIYARSYTLM